MIPGYYDTRGLWIALGIGFAGTAVFLLILWALGYIVSGPVS